MSLDRNDLARTTQQQQSGVSQNFWPIIIDPTDFSLGVPYEIAINPCDHIFLPTFYDASFGLNPLQVPDANDNVLPFTGAGGLFNDAPLGCNAFDVWDQNPNNPNGVGWIQRAASFSLQFNSPNAPWLLWGLGSLLSVDGGLYYQLGGANCCQVGQGDSMRSISGPISRLFIKFNRWALTWSMTDQAAYVSPRASRIVMMSTLGYSVSTVGSTQSRFDSSQQAGNTPNYAANSVLNYVFEGGGYVTPQLNTLEQLELELKGLGSSVTARGLPKL